MGPLVVPGHSCQRLLSHHELKKVKTRVGQTGHCSLGNCRRIPSPMHSTSSMSMRAVVTSWRDPISTWSLGPSDFPHLACRYTSCCPQAFPRFVMLPSPTLRTRPTILTLFATMPNQVPAAIKFFAEKQQQGKFTFQAGRYVRCLFGSRSPCHFLPFTVVVLVLFFSAPVLAGLSPRWVARSQSLPIIGERG